jgi:hypothetical protein
MRFALRLVEVASAQGHATSAGPSPDGSSPLPVPGRDVVVAEDNTLLPALISGCWRQGAAGFIPPLTVLDTYGPSTLTDKYTRTAKARRYFAAANSRILCAKAALMSRECMWPAGMHPLPENAHPPMVMLRGDGGYNACSGTYWRVPDNAEYGHCLASAASDYQGWLRQCTPGLVALCVAGALPEATLVLENGYGLLTTSGQLYWKGALPEVFFVCDDEHSVWHVTGWTYVCDVDNKYAHVDSPMPLAKLGGRKQNGTTQQPAVFSAAVATAENRAKQHPEDHDPASVALAYMANARLKGPVSTKGLKHLALEVAHRWNQRFKHDSYKPVSYRKAAHVSGLHALTVAGPVYSNLAFSPIGKGPSRYTASFDGYKPDGTQAGVEQEYALIGAYAMASALSDVPCQQAYLAFETNDAHSYMGFTCSLTPPEVLKTPCSVILTDDSANTFHWWGKCFHDTLAKDPGALIRVYVVGLTNIRATGVDGTMAFRDAGIKEAYDASGWYWSGEDSLGSCLRNLGPTQQVATTGHVRCLAGWITPTVRSSSTSPVVVSNPLHMSDEMRAMAIRVTTKAGVPLPHWLMAPAEEDATPPTPAFTREPSSATTPAAAAERPVEIVPDHWEDAIPADDGRGSAHEALPGAPSHAPDLPPAGDHPEGCPCTCCCDYRRDFAAFEARLAMLNAPAPAKKPASASPGVRGAKAPLPSLKAFASSRKRSARTQPYAPVKLGFAKRSDWYWAGPNGVHHGVGAETKAGPDATSLPPCAATAALAIAQKTKYGDAPPLSKYNLATSAFYLQNAAYSKLGYPLLDENDKAYMVESAPTFVDFCMVLREARSHTSANKLLNLQKHLMWLARNTTRGLLLRCVMRVWRSMCDTLWSFWHWAPYPWTKVGPKPLMGPVDYSHCPRALVTDKLAALKVFSSIAEATANLSRAPDDRVELAFCKPLAEGALADCQVKPRVTYNVGPYLSVGAATLAGCPCAAFHTAGERCTVGMLRGPTCQPAVVDAVFDHAIASMEEAVGAQGETFLNEVLESPRSLEEYAAMPKFRLKYGLLSVFNRHEPVDGPPASDLLVKNELVFNDKRGRLVINVNARKAASGMGPHQSLFSVMKLGMTTKFDGIHTRVITSGLSPEALLHRFQTAGDKGYFHACLSDATACEATQTVTLMKGSHRLLSKSAQLIELVHPDPGTILQNSKALEARASMNTHVMNYADKQGSGSKGFSIVAHGYFPTGSPWTTVETSAAVGSVVIHSARDKDTLTSVAGDDHLSLLRSEKDASEMAAELDSTATACGFIFRSEVGDIRASPSNVVYNQKHVVYHDGTVWLFQHPSRGLRRMGRVVEPNCADPRYLRGHAKAYLLSFASEYAGCPLFSAYVTAGLEYLRDTSPVFNKDTAYWAGMNFAGMPMTPKEARAASFCSGATCPAPSLACRLAYEHAFLVSVERQIEVEELLKTSWSGADWSLSPDLFVDLLFGERPSEEDKGLCNGVRVPLIDLQARV